jgi:hypothetical protein
MYQTNFVRENQSITLGEETPPKVEEPSEAAPKPKVTDGELCKDLLMMCMFSTYYSGFYPDLSMFR